MLRNIIKIVLRDLSKDKIYSGIGIIGLSAAISISILILVVNFSFLNFDKFHKKGERIYKVFGENNYLNAGSRFTSTMPCKLGDALYNQYPEINNSVTVKDDAPIIFIVGNNKFEQKGIYSQESLFNIFSFPIIEKISSQIFTDDNSIAISKNLAEKYFGSVQNAIGKKIILRRTYEKKEAFVSSVFKDIPTTSSIKFEYVLPLSSILKTRKELNTWGELAANTYLELKAGVNVNTLNNKIAKFLSDHHPVIKEKLILFKYENLFLHPPGRFNKIYSITIFFIIALIVLVIASINFISLATSRATKKAKEIGLRKVLGAKRKSLLLRFMTENFILTFFAVILGLIIAKLLMQYMNQDFSNIMLLALPTNNQYFNISFVILFIFVGVLSGLYPSLYLSSLSPVEILKGNSESAKKLNIRKILISLQFIFSTLFIFLLIVVIKQSNYIIEADHGLNIKQIIELNITDNISKHLESFTNDLKSDPKIKGVTFANFEPTGIYSSTSDPKWEGKPESLNDMFPVVTVGDNFINTFDMKIVKGRDFIASNTADNSNYLVNEKMAKIISKFGKGRVVGADLSFWGNNGQIIGIVKNFQNESFRESVQPLIIRKEISNCNFVFVKTNTKDVLGVIKSIKRTYLKYESEYPFKYYFLDNQFIRKHIDIILFNDFFSILSIITIVISCLGLFGLTAFTVQQKTKEIGIRKVVGASVSSISILLSKSIIKLVLIGSMIALPIGYYLSNLVLQIYSSKIKITVDIYIYSVGIVLFIAAMTVVILAVKAATANPVKSLKYE